VASGQLPVLNQNPVVEVTWWGMCSFCNPAAGSCLPDVCHAAEHPWLEDWEAVGA